MPKNPEQRPEWFKVWRRNRRQLDISELSLESRGVVFTNVLRFFDDYSTENLLDMDPLEAFAFNCMKINIDDAYSDYAERAEVNRINGSKGGRPPKTEKTESVKNNRKNPK